MKKIDFHRHSLGNKEDLTIISLDLKSLENESLPKNHFFSIGLHPWWINKLPSKKIYDFIKKNHLDPYFFGLGECGLDRSIDIDFSLQKKVFEEQLELAKKLNIKVIIIHCVKAFNEIIHSINKMKIKANIIFHDYNGNPSITQELVDRGHYLSVGRHLFDSKTNQFKSLPIIPLSQLLLETDDFQLSLGEIYQKTALLLNLNEQKLIKQMNENFETIKKA